LRGRRKLRHIVETLTKKLKKVEAIVQEQGAEAYTQRRARIKKGIKSTSETYLDKRRTVELEDLLSHRNEEPFINAVMRETGYEVTARLREMIPVSDVKKKDNHEDSLDQEIFYRHIVPYLPFGDNSKAKRTHPVPTTETVVGRPFVEMTFTQKKFLLMADEERMWRMEGKDMKDFDVSMFRVQCEDVLFEIPTT